jgi:hypothetical protein
MFLDQEMIPCVLLVVLYVIWVLTPDIVDDGLLAFSCFLCFKVWFDVVMLLRIFTGLFWYGLELLLSGRILLTFALVDNFQALMFLFEFTDMPMNQLFWDT